MKESNSQDDFKIKVQLICVVKVDCYLFQFQTATLALNPNSSCYVKFRC